MLMLNPSQEPPHGFEKVVGAFHVALQMHGLFERPWRVGICNPKGELAAVGELVNQHQLDTFVRLIRAIGFSDMTILGSAAEMHGCDILFDCPASSTASDVFQAA